MRLSSTPDEILRAISDCLHHSPLPQTCRRLQRLLGGRHLACHLGWPSSVRRLQTLPEAAQPATLVTMRPPAGGVRMPPLHLRALEPDLEHQERFLKQERDRADVLATVGTRPSLRHVELNLSVPPGGRRWTCERHQHETAQWVRFLVRYREAMPELLRGLLARPFARVVGLRSLAIRLPWPLLSLPHLVDLLSCCAQLERLEVELPVDAMFGSEWMNELYRLVCAGVRCICIRHPDGSVDEVDPAATLERWQRNGLWSLSLWDGEDPPEGTRLPPRLCSLVLAFRMDDPSLQQR